MYMYMYILIFLPVQDAQGLGQMPPSHSVERYVCETAVLEMLHMYKHNFKLCARQLIDFSDSYPPQLPVDFIIIEVS